MSASDRIATRIPRSLEHLVRSCIRHLNLLRRYHLAAFNDRKPEYAGEVAGKIRLLVIDARQNTPLFLWIAAAFGFEPVIFRNLEDGPPIDLKYAPPGYTSTVRLVDYLQWHAATLDGHRLSNRDVVCDWAQMNGSAHEDVGWSERFAVFQTVSSQIWLGRSQPHLMTLEHISAAVLNCATNCLRHIDAAALATASKVYDVEAVQSRLKDVCALASRHCD